MVAFQYRMPSGIPGNVNRLESATIEAGITNTTNPPTRFGDPLVATATGNGGFRPVLAGDTVTSVRGFLVRPYPTQGAASWPSDALTNPASGTPSTTAILNILRRGYIHVLVVGAGQAVAGGPVYCRTVAASAPNNVVGAIEATADGSNSFIIPHCEFVGPQDAQGNGEIRVFTGVQ